MPNNLRKPEALSYCAFLPRYLLIICLPVMAAGQVHAFEELQRLDKLTPMPGPDQRNIGWEWHYIDQNGKPGYMRKITATESTASYNRSDGCQWTRDTRGFAPATVWSDCPSSGKAKVDFVDGDIWPLKVGNKFSYQMLGTSSFLGFKWSGKRNCVVSYSVRVKIVSGEYDSFKVVCHERWGTRSWWLSPEVGTAVAYQQETSRDEIILQEMTRIFYNQ
jgi:hypothetical protein